MSELPQDSQIPRLRNLLWITLIGVGVFAAPATMPLNPTAVPTALAIAVWCLAVTIIGLRTLQQVGLSNSGFLTPFLVLLIAMQSAIFCVIAYRDAVSRPPRPAQLQPTPVPPQSNIQ